MRKKITAQQFKEDYANLRDKFSDAKKRLIQIKKELVVLGRDAKRLYRKSNRDLYVDVPNDWPKPAFSGLDKYMENLIDWDNTWGIVANAIKFLPISTKRNAQ